MRNAVNNKLIIDRLILNLELQLEVHEVLLDALKQEGDLPASCTLMELQEVHSVRNNAVLRIQELEKDRLSLVDFFKQQNQLMGQISLKQLYEHCEPDNQKKLTELRKGLLEVVQKIKPAGRKNAEIAVARIACFNEIQKVYDKSFNRLSTYSGKGVVTKARGSSRMNRSI